MRNFKIVGFALAVVALILTVVTASACDVSVFSYGSDIIAAGAPLALYERKIFEQLVGKHPGAVVSPSFLRVEQKLTNSKNTYAFNLKNIGGEAETEVKLDRNDKFVVTRLGLYLLKKDTTKVGLGALQTYANTTVFASATGFTPSHLETIYNGYTSLKVNQTVIIEKLSNYNFLYKPTSQQTATIIYSEWNMDNFAYTLPSLWNLHGTDNIDLTVSFPSYANIAIAAVAANTENHLVMVPYGFLVKNGADGKR